MVCIVHSLRDRVLARRLAADLIRAGISARADLFELSTPDSLRTRLEAVVGCSIYVCLVSDSTGTPGWLTKTAVDTLHGAGRVVWAITGTEPPGNLLSGGSRVDLRDYVAGLNALNDRLSRLSRGGRR